jgi:hypothetical protein
MLSEIDRDSNSKTFGNFDREYWGWKFRDFPLGMLQTAVYPLALLWRYPFPGNPYYGNQQLLDWIIAAIEQTLSHQHSNGAFDAFAPNEQDISTTLGIMYGLSETFRIIRTEMSALQIRQFLISLRKACDFSLKREEEHGFITNHRGYFALTMLNSYELLENKDYLHCAEEIVQSILSNQSEEGWYLEYEGPDPGYESLGLFYLAVYWLRTGARSVLESLRKCVDFYAYCVHPNGSIGGIYGSRHTHLYCPGGFEILAGEIPLAASIAKFMRERLDQNNVVTPAVSDRENLPALAYTYLEASLVSNGQLEKSTELLPCQYLSGVQHFPRSLISVVGTENYYAVINSNKGGVCCVFSKRTNELVYQDAGYLVWTEKKLFSSQINGLSYPVKVESEYTIANVTQMGEVRQELLTPARLLVLRTINLTLFHSARISAWLRRLIVKRLILTKRPGPITLQRTVIFDKNEIRFQDTLTNIHRVKVNEVALPRSFMAIHMGSAKYFHTSELTATPLPCTDGLADELSQAYSTKCVYTLRFTNGIVTELVNYPSRMKTDFSRRK